MLPKVECYPCILTQIAMLAKKATGDENRRRELLINFMREVIDSPSDTIPPEYASLFHRQMRDESGETDPFRAIKDNSTELGLRLLPVLKKRVEESTTPFETAVRLAIGGNIIDYGVFPDFDLEGAEEQILSVLDMPFDRDCCAELERRMNQANRIFYMLDNCGEAVIDRLLIEPFAHKIVVGVRGEPILNDVTRRDVARSGITGVPIFDTGDMAPGVSLRNSSKEFLDALRGSDLVITKGQGNYESLDTYERPIFHLLRIKCKVVARELGQPLGALQICARNLR